MLRDPQAVLRRAALVLEIALFAVIAAMNASDLRSILARAEPNRSLRLAVGVSSVLLGSIAAGLLVRDVRGRGLPLSVTLQPAWLVFGFHLVDFYFFTRKALFLVTGGLALLLGLWGLSILVRALRRSAPA